MLNDTAIEVRSYEELCDSCREMVASMDEKRWLIGDTSLVIESHYGERTTDDFAKNIGIAKSSAYQYKKMSSFYDPATRARIRDDMPNLTYSHLRTALRLETVVNAFHWLEECSANGYSVDEASRKLTESLGRETRESITGEVSRKFTQEDGYFLVIKLDHDSEWNTGTAVTLKAK